MHVCFICDFVDRIQFSIDLFFYYVILVGVVSVIHKNAQDNSCANLTLMEQNPCRAQCFSTDRKMQLSLENQKFDCRVH